MLLLYTPTVKVRLTAVHGVFTTTDMTQFLQVAFFSDCMILYCECLIIV